MSAWSIRGRILATLLALLLFTALGAGIFTRGAVLQPLLGAVTKERIEVAGTIAREVRRAADREAKVAELSEELGVEITLSADRPRPSDTWVRRIGRGRHHAYVEQGPGSPIHVPLGRPGSSEAGFLTVRFEEDLSRPGRVVALGMLLLVFVAGVGALLMSRWATRPLDLAGEAMARIAGGELGHRLPEGAGEAGRMARSFNEMAGQVQAAIAAERRHVEGQRRLMGAVSHELRTPLARMRLQTELLRDAGADPARVASLERQIGEIDELVGELVESLRMEGGAVALSLGEVHLAGLLAEALADVDLGDRPVTVEVPEDLRLRADGRRLLRVLRNLLSNVARYTPADAPVAVEARALPPEDGAEGERVELQVRDGGPGVPPSELPHLFEPFYRVEGSRSRTTGGLGLGLMLVRQIVQAHAGSVTASRAPEGGLQLTIRLPQGGPSAA